MKPDPLQAVCDTSLFQDIFTQTLNSSIDIQTIQATLCSLNLSDIDALLNDIFKANGMIVQVSELYIGCFGPWNTSSENNVVHHIKLLEGGPYYFCGVSGGWGLEGSCIYFLHVFQTWLWAWAPQTLQSNCFGMYVYVINFSL